VLVDGAELKEEPWGPVARRAEEEREFDLDT
jgi:hypothetical protein